MNLKIYVVDIDYKGLLFHENIYCEYWLYGPLFPKQHVVDTYYKQIRASFSMKTYNVNTDYKGLFFQNNMLWILIIRASFSMKTCCGYWL